MNKSSVTIIVADDDADDRLLITDAFKESRLANPLVFVEDGEQLLQFLDSASSGASGHPLPGLILLDLNMPRMDGRTALSHIKSNPHLRRIPVIVLTTYKAEEDVLRTYDLGVNSFITKPVTFEGLVDVVQSLNHYWIEIVELPATASMN
jgi:CheY-like chemotaxis protein